MEEHIVFTLTFPTTEICNLASSPPFQLTDLVGGKENWVSVSHVYNESSHSNCIGLQVPRVGFPDPLAKWSLYRSLMKDMKSLCYKDLRSGTLFAKTCSGWRREHEHRFIPCSPFFRNSGWPQVTSFLHPDLEQIWNRREWNYWVPLLFNPRMLPWLLEGKGLSNPPKKKFSISLKLLQEFMLWSFWARDFPTFCYYCFL